MMPLQRRMLLSAAVLIPGTMAARISWSESLWATHRGCQTLFLRPPVDELPALMGEAAPTEEEIVTAFDLLWNVPRNSTPVEIAEHIAEVALNRRNADGEPYNQEWSFRANPLIIYMFAMTQTLPSGDLTPWCAAFVNFCLYAAGKDGTKHAGSSTFRTYKSEASEPRRGDIVVFRDNEVAWRGHVGFLDQNLRGDNSGMVEVLGGNQSNQIKVSSYEREGSRLSLHSFRRIA